MMVREGFHADMEKLARLIRYVAEKHELPTPALVLHPEWRNAINHSATRISPYYRASEQFEGVTIHFGITRQERVIL